MTTSVDVLAVMDSARRGLDSHDEYRLGTNVHEARAAVAELIEAIEDQAHKAGPKFTCEEWLESSRRVLLSLARVKGA